MGTEVLKSFSHLQSELEEAKSSLKGVDEHIKRLIGRDPSDLPPRLGQKRPLDDKNVRQPYSKFSRGGFDHVDVPKRRNPNAVSVFKRLSDKIPEDPVKTPSKGLISKVIAAPKEVPSRQAMLDKQNKDERFKERNRRMFGALLGTLQRFQQEECKLKKREEKRTQIEKKIEEHEQQEKEEIKKERQELFLNRKKKQQEIKMIELKMLRMKEYAAWEQSQKPTTNFIVTKAKPHIHYLPRRMDNKTRELLESSKKDIEEHIEKRRQAVFEELNHIEERMKKNFESKNNIEVKEISTDRHDRHRSDSEFDDDGDIKMKSPSPAFKGEIEGEIKDTEEIKETVSIENKEETVQQEMQHGNSGMETEGEVPSSDTQNVEETKNDIDNHVLSDQSVVNDLYNSTDTNNDLNSSQTDVDSLNIYSQNSDVSNISVIVNNNENGSEEATQDNI